MIKEIILYIILVWIFLILVWVSILLIYEIIVIIKANKKKEERCYKLNRMILKVKELEK